jgi:L-asparagine transporter-like permease
MAHGSEGQLGKGLRQRHLAMIAIGGDRGRAFRGIWCGYR